MANISFEFFPPRSHLNFLKLLETQKKLSAFSPRFVSITSSSKAEDHLDVITASTRFFGTVVPHVLCASKEVMVQMAGSYSRVRTDQLVILRGDQSILPSFSWWGIGETIHLVRTEWGSTFLIDVAAYPDGHPKSETTRCDLSGLTTKIASGASSAISQYSFSPDIFFGKVSELRSLGIRSPISPGVMISSDPNLLGRMAKFCGSEAPSWVNRRRNDVQPEVEKARQFCIEITSQLCENLIECGMPDLHFYTLNDHRSVREVCSHIGNCSLESQIFPS